MKRIRVRRGWLDFLPLTKPNASDWPEWAQAVLRGDQVLFDFRIDGARVHLHEVNLSNQTRQGATVWVHIDIVVPVTVTGTMRVHMLTLDGRELRQLSGQWSVMSGDSFHFHDFTVSLN